MSPYDLNSGRQKDRKELTSPKNGNVGDDEPAVAVHKENGKLTQWNQQPSLCMREWNFPQPSKEKIRPDYLSAPGSKPF